MKRETLLETENKREKTRILTFRNMRGDREIAQVVSCRFDNLSGVIAAVAREIEKQHGGFWSCVEVQVYVPESGGQIKMGETKCSTRFTVCGRARKEGTAVPNDDYIKRSDALKAILGMSIYDTIEELEGARTIAENTWADGLWDAYKIIEEEVDAADVAEVRNGRWEYDSDGVPCCTACGGPALQRLHLYFKIRSFTAPFVKSEICPNCGAKMDKEEDNA